MTFRIRNGNQPTLEIREGSTLRYGLDLTHVLAPGDTVVSVTASANVGTVSGAGTDATGTSAMARIADVTAGESVELKLAWQTAQGDIDSRTLFLPVIAR